MPLVPTKEDLQKRKSETTKAEEITQKEAEKPEEFLEQEMKELGAE